MKMKCLILFTLLLIHAVNADIPEEYLKMARNAPKMKFESVEDLMAHALIDKLTKDIFSRDEYTDDFRDIGGDSNFRIPVSEPRMDENIWDDNSGDSSSIEDPDENDALHSRQSSNPSKRDDYYEGLEKKSQRITYAPPARKNFYTAPENLDSSASEEHSQKVRVNDRRLVPNRKVDQNDHYPKKDPLTDIIQAESQLRLDSLIAPALHGFTSSPIPPWRFPAARSHALMLTPPVIIHEKPQPYTSHAQHQHHTSHAQQHYHHPHSSPTPSAPEEERVDDSEEETALRPQITKARAANFHRTFKKSSTVPRKPAEAFVSKVYFKEETKPRSAPRPKPRVPQYSKSSITPKFAGHEDNAFLSTAGLGKSTRQQFHEQGTHGRHSYKFGFNTGDKENPMARYEERDADGVVRGAYSYIDPRGHKQVVQYESHPKLGFKTKITSDM